ncbi:LysR family transcriptional regulator [Paludibacterium yongneupense]|uniref:LysR family transcriptional regulator n=1 Tax=Paludibacterium yongneupense TaxID=400061 RepID=UPI00041096A3|nr:LysR family transcriptional regulator [Paludibacterium yongneupense]
MEWRQLRYFVCVVDCGSVSAAARSVHVAQPALTRQIHQLEENLGVVLFTRSAHGMALTEAGRILYDEARHVLEEVERVRGRIRALGAHASGNLALGVTSTHLWLPQVSSLLRDFRARHPTISLQISPILSQPQVELLLSGRLDAGVMFLRPSTQPLLQGIELYREHFCLAVPAASPLAEAPPETLADVGHEDFIWFPRAGTPDYYDFLMEAFQRAGFLPRIVQEGSDNVTVLSLVAAGLGVSVVPAASRHRSIDGICFIDLPELKSLQLPLELVWKENHSSPPLCELLATARGHGTAALRAAELAIP